MEVIYENYIIHRSGKVSGRDSKFLKMNVNSFGYKVFKVWYQGKTKNLQIHRELAKAFIPNPKNLPCVNHKDGNKLNNRMSNLEWCTYSQNNKHAYDTGLKLPKSVSNHRYISFENQTKKWRVSINKGEKRVVKGGRHSTIEQALKERNKLIKIK